MIFTGATIIYILYLFWLRPTPASTTCDHIGSMKVEAELAAFCRISAFANKFSIFFAKVFANTNNPLIFVLSNAIKRAGKFQIMLVVRQSDHIQEDIKRNWSSWNFGQDGFKGTREELDAYLETCDEDSPVCISMFELYPDELKRTKFDELYQNYWVVVDDRGGLSVNILEQDNLTDAIEFIQNNKWFCGGDGNFVDASDAVVVWSDGNTHILQIPE